jgi:tRNA modification GTPase
MAKPLVAKPDTIAAIATAPGRGAIGVVRVSGSALDCWMPELFGRSLSPRHATAATFLAADRSPLDSGIALYFPAPASYTGEDVLELQGHGGSAVLKSLLRRCVELGARHAEPGEFTRRAFLNGKIDLAQAEAVADLIEASSLVAARAAVGSLTGIFSAAIDALKQDLLELRTQVEAQIDFSEDDIGTFDLESFRNRLWVVSRHIQALLNRALEGRRMRDGLKIALLGAPNVGKSTLMNYLAAEPVAIVTDIPGTTRDAIAVDITLDGVPITVVDTAGIRETSDPVEKIGVARALKAAEDADIVVYIYDSEKQLLPLAPLNTGKQSIKVLNKVDLLSEHRALAGIDHYVSAKTGFGLPELRESILEKLGGQGPEEHAFTARLRHVTHIEEAIHCIDCASREGASLELMAEELRLANVALERITGHSTTEDLLGEIFSTFCIGK